MIITEIHEFMKAAYKISRKNRGIIISNDPSIEKFCRYDKSRKELQGSTGNLLAKQLGLVQYIEGNSEYDRDKTGQHNMCFTPAGKNYIDKNIPWWRFFYKHKIISIILAISTIISAIFAILRYFK